VTLLGIAAALAVQVMPNVFIGPEARMLRHYEGLGLNSLAGQALYVGPTLYATFGQGYFLSAAWNVQVWGAVAGSSGALDLVISSGIKRSCASALRFSVSASSAPAGFTSD
jgi:hypothetical protein